jgi:ech hydrogenase subunit D
MTWKPDIEIITVDKLRDRVAALRQQGMRLVQISATRLPAEVELTYSFDLNDRLSNLRLLIPGEDSVLPSISGIFGCAVLYENEIHDLFDVRVDGMTVDFKGRLYTTSVKFPFGSTKPPAAVSSCSDPDPSAQTTKP